MNKIVVFVVVLTMLLTSCAPAATQAPAAAANPGLQMDSAKVAPQYFNDADYAKSMDYMKQKALNPSDPIYLQYLVDNKTNISKFPQYAAFASKKAPYNLCFSNAGVNNPWRVVGYIDHARAGRGTPRSRPGQELLSPGCPGQ